MLHDRSGLGRDDDAASGGGALRLIGTIAIAFGLNGTLAAARVITPIMALELGASGAVVGVLMGLFTVLPILGTVLYGRWVDRIGSLGPARVAAGLVAGSALFMLASPGLWTLALASPFIGAGTVFGHVALSRAVASASDIRIRTRNLGYLAVGYSLCQMIAPAVAGLAYDLAGSRGAYAFLALLALASLALTLSGLTLLSGHADAPAGSAVRRRTVELLAAPGMPRMLWLFGIFSTSVAFFAMALPMHGNEIGFTASQVGALYGMLSAGGAISRLVAGRLARRFAPRALMTGALVLGAAACTILPFLSVWAVLALATFLFGAFVGLGFPVTLASIYQIAPAGRANESVGLGMTVTNLLQLCTPLLLGLVATVWGVGPMIWSFAAALAVSSLIAFRDRAGAAAREGG